MQLFFSSRLKDVLNFFVSLLRADLLPHKLPKCVLFCSHVFCTRYWLLILEQKGHTLEKANQTKEQVLVVTELLTILNNFSLVITWSGREACVSVMVEKWDTIAFMVTYNRSVTHSSNYVCLTDSISVNLHLCEHIQMRLPWLCLHCREQRICQKKRMKSGRRRRMNPGISNADVATASLTWVRGIQSE